MSGGVVDIPVTGKVDAALIQGLIDLGRSLEDAAKKTDDGAEKTQRAAVSWASFSDGIRKAADTFNEVHAAISTNVAMINGLVDSVTRLASEQAHLDAASSRLGLDFDQAAAAAGRFADETDALSIANQFAARDVRLTQEQIDALFRVAGSRAEELGVTVGEAADQLTQALIRGREAGLDRFGQALGEVAGEGHQVGDRLAALVVQAGQVRQGTDDASTSMERFRDSMGDAQRIAATAFVDTLTRIESMADRTRTASTEVADLNDKMSALGSTAARTLELVGRPIAGLLGVLGIAARAAAASAIITAAYRDGPEAGNRAAREQLDALREMARFVSDQGGGFAAAWNDTNGRGSSGERGSAPTTPGSGPQVATRADMSFSEDQARAIGATIGAHGQTIAGPDGLTRSDAAIADEQAKQKANERLTAAQGTHQARKDELAKLYEIHAAEARARQEAELRRDAARTTAEAREREARAFNEWLTASLDRLQREQQAEKDRETAKTNAERDREKARDLGNQMRDFTQQQILDAHSMADAIEAAYGRMTGAASAHFAALVTGRETAGDALQGFVHDTLAAFAEIAAQQAIFELAKGFAALFINPAEAAAHFGAAALFGLAAAGAGAAAQAVGSPQQAAAAAGGSAAPNRQLNDRPSSRSETAAPIVIHYHQPVIGEREVTSAEIGERLARFGDDASRTRVSRRAA